MKAPFKISLLLFENFHIAKLESSLSLMNLKFSINSVKSPGIFHKLDLNIFWTNKNAFQMRPSSLDFHPSKDDWVGYV